MEDEAGSTVACRVSHEALRDHADRMHLSGNDGAVFEAYRVSEHARTAHVLWIAHCYFMGEVGHEVEAGVYECREGIRQDTRA